MWFSVYYFTINIGNLKKMRIFMKKKMPIRYESLNHSKYRIRYHVIFSTKYRKPCLVGIEDGLSSILCDISSRCNFNVLSVGVDRNHVHMVIKASPSISPSQIVRRLKQLSTKYLWQRYEPLLKNWQQYTCWLLFLSVANIRK